MSDQKTAAAGTAPAIQPLPTILTEKDLSALRAGYEADPGSLADAPLAKYSAMYPQGEPFYSMSVETFYIHGPPPGTPPKSKLPQEWREVAILALFIEQRQTVTLAVHFYWSLMLGMTVENLCEICLLMGFYASISSYSLALNNMQLTLTTLKTCAESGQTAPKDVFAALGKAFPS